VHWYVDGIQPKVGMVSFGRSDDVVLRKYFGDVRARPSRPDAVLWRHFGGNVNLAAGLANHLSNELFAMPIAISQRGIDEVQTQLDGSPERGDRILVASAQPLFAADTPGAIADTADGEVGAPEFAKLRSEESRVWKWYRCSG